MPSCLLILLLGGCSAPRAELVTVDSSVYARAFDVAVAAARDEGLPPAYRDRRGGVIETEAVHAATLLEPWAQHGESLGHLIESTLAHQRRWARFEFAIPGRHDPDVPARSAGEGPDVLLTGPDPVDLTRHEGPLELRVRVFLERAYRPGIRQSTWTLAKTTRTVAVTESGESMRGQFWTPVARDPDFEGRLLGQVQQRLRLPERD